MKNLLIRIIIPTYTKTTIATKAKNAFRITELLFELVEPEDEPDDEPDDEFDDEEDDDYEEDDE